MESSLGDDSHIEIKGKKKVLLVYGEKREIAAREEKATGKLSASSNRRGGEIISNIPSTS